MDIKLRQLYRRFGHLSAGKLHKVLKRARHETDKKIIDNLTKDGRSWRSGGSMVTGTPPMP